MISIIIGVRRKGEFNFLEHVAISVDNILSIRSRIDSKDIEMDYVEIELKIAIRRYGRFLFSVERYTDILHKVNKESS